MASDRIKMQEILMALAALSTRTQQVPRADLSYRHGLLNRHVAGDGLLPGDDPENLPAAEEHENENTVFIPENEPDAAYVDDGGVVEDSLHSDEDQDEDEVDAYVKWVNALAPYIKKLYKAAPAGETTPCPYLAMIPRDHQYRALTLIERAQKSLLKAIHIADPPGLGKTLIAMMAVVKNIANAKRFSIVVAPASCLEQWENEFKTFFEPGRFRVLVVRDATVPPNTMLDYDVVIVTYGFVMSSYRKYGKYLEKIAALKEGAPGPPPQRPGLSLFSEIFLSDDDTKFPLLVLDEVNYVKNPRSLTFKATMALRERSDFCLMLSGSPIDNSWPDVFALLSFVEGHAIWTRSKFMRLLATTSDSGKQKPPTGEKFLQFLQILNSFMVRRPETTINLPPLSMETYDFYLSSREEYESNDKFDRYETAMRIAAGEKMSDEERGTAFKSLTQALQLACHPKLVELMKHIRLCNDKNQELGSSEEDDVLYDAASIAKWAQWRDSLAQDGEWMSSRIQALIDVYNMRRDLDPDCSVIIFDESVYYLDIVQIALENMYEPVKVLRYDGRIQPEKRGGILEEFKKAKGEKILLMSRGTGGVGLNIQSANVVILCGPWWKAEWEEQAFKRAWRPGQTRPVTVIKLLARNCSAEHYKAKARNRKQKFNSKVLTQITRIDDEVPKTWDNF